jgi:acyl-CoA hydrolase
VTVAIAAMNFRKPVYVGDLVSVHANLIRIGRTSITVHLEAWVLRRKEMQSILVTDGNFTLSRSMTRVIRRRSSRSRRRFRLDQRLTASRMARWNIDRRAPRAMIRIMTRA